MNVLKQFLGSKKAIASAVTVLVNLIVGFMPADTIDGETKMHLILAITGIVGAYVLAQGRADQGKEAKKIEVAAGGGGSE